MSWNKRVSFSSFEDIIGRPAGAAATHLMVVEQMEHFCWRESPIKIRNSGGQEGYYYYYYLRLNWSLPSQQKKVPRWSAAGLISSQFKKAAAKVNYKSYLLTCIIYSGLYRASSGHTRTERFKVHFSMSDSITCEDSSSSPLFVHGGTWLLNSNIQDVRTIWAFNPKLL